VLDTKPMPADPKAISLFEIFAARAAAEQRRLKAELELRAREEQLTRLLESAMDAILVLDARRGRPGESGRTTIVRLQRGGSAGREAQ
jgi:PAS domain-containing protein